MRIVSRKAIREASRQHPEWTASLNAWFKITKNAAWANVSQLKNSLRNVDAIGKFVIFDISDNRCRLIATVKYRWKIVYVRFVLTHAEYERKEWLNE
jgi:mRNA interferase HigB